MFQLLERPLFPGVALGGRDACMPRASSQFHARASYADPRGELAARWYDYELVSYARRDDGFYVGAGRNAGGLTMTFESQMGPGDAATPTYDVGRPRRGFCSAVSRKQRKMYCGHARLCVCLSVCLSVCGRTPTLLHGPGCSSGAW